MMDQLTMDAYEGLSSHVRATLARLRARVARRPGRWRRRMSSRMKAVVPLYEQGEVDRLKVMDAA